MFYFIYGRVYSIIYKREGKIGCEFGLCILLFVYKYIRYDDTAFHDESTCISYRLCAYWASWLKDQGWPYWCQDGQEEDGKAHAEDSAEFEATSAEREEGVTVIASVNVITTLHATVNVSAKKEKGEVYIRYISMDISHLSPERLDIGFCSRLLAGQ